MLIMCQMKEYFEFLRMAEGLKIETHKIKLSTGADGSVAGHSWAMGLFAILFYDKLRAKVDIGHALKLIIVHDLAESLAGDIALSRQKSPEVEARKHHAERVAIKKMIAVLPQEKGDEIMSLWEEYNAMETPESKFVKACDKLEGMVQSLMFKNVSYWEEYGEPGFYFDDRINRRRERFWKHEPVLIEFYEYLRDITIERMNDEGFDYKKYLDGGVE